LLAELANFSLACGLQGQDVEVLVHGEGDAINAGENFFGLRAAINPGTN
jgi:hypothetical protein